MNTLASLAQQDSLAAFRSCLTAQSHSPSELFDALRVALLWNQPEKVQLLLNAGADPNLSETLAAAGSWRWLGAASLLKRFGAKNRGF